MRKLLQTALFSLALVSSTAIAGSAFLAAGADRLSLHTDGGGSVTGELSVIGGPVTMDAANTETNTYGGQLTKLGLRTQTAGSTAAIGSHSHAEGTSTTASGDASHAEGEYTTASGSDSHAEGEYTTASGSHSHAEGYATTASGDASHAEGFDTTASDDASHAEGYATTASGYASHAEGEYTTASGYASHAAGLQAVASNDYSYVWSGSASPAVSTADYQFTVKADNGIRLLGGPLMMEHNSEPADPPDGICVIWVSNGVGAGDDGDLMIKKSTVGSGLTTNTVDITAL